MFILTLTVGFYVKAKSLFLIMFCLSFIILKGNHIRKGSPLKPDLIIRYVSLPVFIASTIDISHPV